ncbi:ketopantoate reductase family protein [Elstera sp.]|jgi:2-dehydropantoate 2-reductase|uniref:ketopantoate reductase family protein n=1 Tax=Elstera sp. TaxID=1916664 RepID=UPI0037BEC671
MKITILGAGAVGGHIAARLAKAGLAVSVIARGPHLAAIQANGLRLTTEAEDFTVRLPASDRAEDFGPQDLIISTVKAHSLTTVVPALKSLSGPQTNIVYAVNGVPWWYFHKHPKPDWAERPIDRLDPGGLLWREVGVERALGCVIQSPNTIVAPGVIHCKWVQSSFTLGDPAGGITPRLAAIVDALKPGLDGVTATEDIRTAVWKKIALNVAGSCLGVLTLSAEGQVIADPNLLPLYETLLSEASAVAAGLGVSAAPDIPTRLKAMAGSTHRASMLQDMEAGRPMEIEAQLGAVQELARLAGVPTPTLDILLPLIRARARR